MRRLSAAGLGLRIYSLDLPARKSWIASKHLATAGTSAGSYHAAVGYRKFPFAAAHTAWQPAWPKTNADKLHPPLSSYHTFVVQLFAFLGMRRLRFPMGPFRTAIAALRWMCSLPHEPG